MARVSLTKAECEALISASVDWEVNASDRFHHLDQTITIYDGWDEDDGECGVTPTDYDEAVRERDALYAQAEAIESGSNKLRATRLRPSRPSKLGR